MAAQIAQLIVPADGIGNPSFCVPDWPRRLVYFVGSGGLRRYSLALETQSPALSVAGISTTVQCAAVDPVTGALLVQSGTSNGEPLVKFDPGTLAQIASYGVATSVPSYPTSFWVGQAMVCVGCGSAANPSALVGYAFLKEGEFQANIDAFRVSDTLVPAGFQQNVTAGATLNRAIMCAGASGATGASVYVTWNGAVNGAAPTLPLQRILVSPGAETYDIASWPTPNPFISIGLIGTLTAASVDPTWTNLAAHAMCYDATDGNVLIDVYTSDAVTTRHYLIKVNGGTAAVLWTAPVLPNADTSLINALSGDQVAHGTLGLLSYTNSESELVTTSSGAVVNAALTGLAANTNFSTSGGESSAVFSSDTAALYFVDVTFTGGGAAPPVPVVGTPSSFTGFAIIGGIIPPPVIIDDFSVGDLWFAPTASFVDFSAAANRRKFIGADGSTSFLGTDGSRPFGTVPPIFLTLPSDGSLPDTWARNFGAGGPFTRSGPDLTLAAAAPPPCGDYTAPITIASNTPQGADPQIILSVSDDGGRTWNLVQKSRSMGKIGEYLTRIRWLKMGQFRQRIIKLEITDPVKRRFVGFYVDNEEGMG